jgi:hypothetical protein
VPEFLEGTVDVPGAGKVKKRYILIPAGLAGVYVAWRWYQASQTDPSSDGGQSSGLYSSDDLSEYGASTTGGSTTVTGNTGSTVTDGTTSTVDTNAEWTRDATEQLANQGYDGAAVTAALGEFLARHALDKTEASIANAAIAVSGQPPENRPWSVIEEASTGTGTLPAPTNLRAWDTTTSTQIGFQWDAVPGALLYRIYRTDIGTEPVGDSIDTKAWAKGLSPNKSYSFYVVPVGTTGKQGGKSSVYTAKTKPVTLTAPTGLKSSAVTKTSFRVTCNKVTGAQYYRWYVNGHASGASDQPYRDFTGLRPNTAYKITVAADTSNQNPGKQSGPLTVKTKK